MQTKVVDQTTQNREVFPLGMRTPSRAPDVDLTAQAKQLLALNFVPGVLFLHNDDILEHTIWVRQSEHEAHKVKERFRLWINGQHETEDKT